MKINKNAIAVMFKAPQMGLVKTRLAVSLGHEKTLLLYIAFLKDYFSRISILTSVDIYVFITPSENALDHNCMNILQEVIPSNFYLRNQVEGDLGDKIQNVFEVLFKENYSNVIVTGSDSPDLPLQYFDDVLKKLEKENTSVFVPAFDGGYCLVAINFLETSFFNNISWSSEKVMGETINILNSNKLSYELLAPWHDIDEVDDLKLLDLNVLPLTADIVKNIE